jgi:hypothetical protein
MAYTVYDMLTLFRRSAEDSAFYPDRNFPNSTSLWSNFELIQYLNEAQRIFAEKTYVFKDSKSFKPAITADDPWIDLDERILKIERAELVSDETILSIKTIEDFQQSGYVDDYGIRRTASWESRTGSPRILIRDIELDKLRVYPIPTEDDYVKLTVRRYPLSELTDRTDEMEVPYKYRYGLLYFMQKEGFSKPQALIAGYGDAALKANLEWNNYLSNVASKVKIRTRGPGQVRYGGL